MKISPGQILAIGLVGIAAVAFYRSAKAARDALNAINPLNNTNVISEGFNDAVGAVTGQEGFSLGSFIFDQVQALQGIEPFDPNNPAIRPQAGFVPPLDAKALDADALVSVAV